MSYRVILTGRGGALASALLPWLPKDILLTSSSPHATELRRCLPLDLAAAEKFDYGVLGKGDVVLHAAAVSAPDVCRQMPELAWAINVDGTSRFIESCLKRGARVLFFSSDTVYKVGGGGIIDEGSPCNPMEPYGRMKHEVEQRFVGTQGFTTLRLSYVVTGVDNYTRYLKGCAMEGEVAEVISAFRRSAVALPDLAEGILAAIRSGNHIQAVVNVCGPETLSRKEIAEAYRAAEAPNLRLREVEAPPGFFDSRPPAIPMTSNYFPALLGRPPMTVAEYYKQLAEET